MIFNIIDRRKQPHAWNRAEGICEPVWHDNNVKGADQYEPSRQDKRLANSDMGCVELGINSVCHLIIEANDMGYPVTLFLYGIDKNGRGLGTAGRVYRTTKGGKLRFVKSEPGNKPKKRRASRS